MWRRQEQLHGGVTNVSRSISSLRSVVLRFVFDFFFSSVVKLVEVMELEQPFL